MLYMNNEDRILSMLGKLIDGQAEMRGDITEMRGDITEIRGDITEIREDITEIREELDTTKNIVLRMELSHGAKLQALFDAYGVNLDSHAQTEQRLTDVEKITEKHTFEISRLKLAK